MLSINLSKTAPLLAYASLLVLASRLSSLALRMQKVSPILKATLKVRIELATKRFSSHTPSKIKLPTQRNQEVNSTTSDHVR